MKSVFTSTTTTMLRPTRQRWHPRAYQASRDPRHAPQQATRQSAHRVSYACACGDGRTVARWERRKRVCAWKVCSSASVVRVCRLRTSTAPFSSSSPDPPSSSPSPGSSRCRRSLSRVVAHHVGGTTPLDALTMPSPCARTCTRRRARARGDPAHGH